MAFALRLSKLSARPFRAVLLLALALPGCMVGPDYVKPAAIAPADWTSWRSGDASLRLSVADDKQFPPDWWRGFNDPVLDELEQRAFVGSPDLKTAAINLARARVQRGSTASEGLPAVNAGAQVTRQRQSEYGASTRLLDSISGVTQGADRDALAKLLAEPFTLYQGGLDASWEIDLWGRVRRSLEAADADIARQSSLLDLARLTLASDVARTYLDLRTAQRQIAIARNDLGLLREQVNLVESRTRGGIESHFDLERQRVELQAVEAQLPSLLVREAELANQIALLIGERPGALTDLLASKPEPSASENAEWALPDLALGLPSEIALRRPDIRAAEARLHSATAGIGIAEADLYPSIRLGGGFNLESYRSENLFDWASRTWSLGPSIDLPLFDGGRRRNVVELRRLDQREAAVAYQQTVLRAWKEIDDALNGYAAEQQRNRTLHARLNSARQAFDLAAARQKGGVIAYFNVIDSHRTWLQAARDLAESDGLLGVRFVALNTAIGNSPGLSPLDGGATP